MVRAFSGMADMTTTTRDASRPQRGRGL